MTKDTLLTRYQNPFQNGKIPEIHERKLKGLLKAKLLAEQQLNSDKIDALIELILPVIWAQMGEATMVFNELICWGTDDPNEAQHLDELIELQLKLEEAQAKHQALRQLMFELLNNY